MTVSDLLRRPGAPGRTAFGPALRRVASALVAWRDRRRQIAALEALPDRTLADLGIGRGQIEDVVRAGGRDAWRRAEAGDSRPRLRWRP